MKFRKIFLNYLIQNLITVNVDIFACTHFREFAKIYNFSHGFIFALLTMPLYGIIKVIFTMYIFSQVFEKRE